MPETNLKKQPKKKNFSFLVLFWVMWYIPGLIPLLGLPGMFLVTAAVPSEQIGYMNAGVWALAIIATIIFPIWGLLSIGLSHGILKLVYSRMNSDPVENRKTIYFTMIYLILLVIPIIYFRISLTLNPVWLPTVHY